MTPRFAAYILPARSRAQIWRTLLGLAVVLVVYLGSVAAAIGVHAALRGPERTETMLAALPVSSTPATLLAVLATFLPILFGLSLACRWLHKRRLSSLIGPGPRALRDFARAMVVFGGIYGGALALYLLFEPGVANLPLAVWASVLPFTLLALLIQTGAEELLFRGYLQQQLAARFAHPIVWALIPSLIFGVLHFDPVGTGAFAPYVVAWATFFGLMAADLTARSGSLGAAWGAHFANNFFAIAVLSVDGTLTGLALRVTSYSVDEIDMTPWLVISELVPMIAAWLILRRWVSVA